VPDRFTDDELRAILTMRWALDDPAVPAPMLEVQRAVMTKARAALGHRALLDDAAARVWAATGGALNQEECEFYARAALGYAVPEPDGGGAEHEEAERGAQGRQDQAERAQGHREGAGEAEGAALRRQRICACARDPALDPRGRARSLGHCVSADRCARQLDEAGL
jgi:hypothetical protein